MALLLEFDLNLLTLLLLCGMKGAVYIITIKGIKYILKFKSKTVMTNTVNGLV